MKIRFSHNNGIYDINKDICLTEAFAEIENESYREMFETGWLPHFDGWYQCRSCRLSLQPISSRRQKELQKVKLEEDPSTDFFFDIAGTQRPSLKYFLSLPHYLFSMDDALLAVVNFFDDIAFFSTLIYDKNRTINSCGTLSYYHLIERYRETHKYLYISTFYDDFAYKSNFPGFEFWDGTKWTTV